MSAEFLMIISYLFSILPISNFEFSANFAYIFNSLVILTRIVLECDKHPIEPILNELSYTL